MTRSEKGPTKGTPARTGGSTDKQAAAAALADECVENIQNLMVRTGAVESWEKCWEQVDEWAGKAETIVSSYVVGLWQILANKSEMKIPLDEEWPRFELLLKRLFARMRKICDEAGKHIADNLPVSRFASARQPLSAKYLPGPEQVEYKIQRLLRKHRLKILRPKDEFSRDFDSWWANYVKPIAESKPRRGRKQDPADMERYQAIARIAHRYDYRDGWKRHTTELAKELDQARISVSPALKKDGLNWPEAEKIDRERFIDTVEYALEQAG